MQNDTYSSYHMRQQYVAHNVQTEMAACDIPNAPMRHVLQIFIVGYKNWDGTVLWAMAQA